MADQALLVDKPSPSLGDYARSYVQRMRSGDLGALPIILGLVVIGAIFQALNQNFLTPRNIVNLISQMAGWNVIAIGVVFVLLLGEIDLSIGYVSAVSAVMMTLMLRPPGGLPWFLGLGLALIAASLIGMVQGLIITRFQLPSFVVTLAGFLVWNGAVLLLIGGAGTVIIQDKTIIGIANYYLPNIWGWILAVVLVAAFALTKFMGSRSRKAQGVATVPLAISVLQVAMLAAGAGALVFIASQDRGLPMVGIILLILLAGFTFLAERTRFGRYVYAIGGSAEAARRAGISVERIRVIVFMISSLMAGAGGVVLASRLRSVDTAAGGGNLLLNSIAAAVIGGTSLFGGRGKVTSAFWGALVIGTIENGMGLLGLSSGVKFIITGSVLLVAVLVDSISRHGRERSGLA